MKQREIEENEKDIRVDFFFAEETSVSCNLLDKKELILIIFLLTIKWN
jgi:hypothetical protein